MISLDLNLKPQKSVGIGTSSFIDVRYDEFNENIDKS